MTDTIRWNLQVPTQPLPLQIITPFAIDPNNQQPCCHVSYEQLSDTDLALVTFSMGAPPGTPMTRLLSLPIVHFARSVADGSTSYLARDIDKLFAYHVDGNGDTWYNRGICWPLVGEAREELPVDRLPQILSALLSNTRVGDRMGA